MVSRINRLLRTLVLLCVACDLSLLPVGAQQTPEASPPGAPAQQSDATRLDLNHFDITAALSSSSAQQQEQTRPPGGEQNQPAPPAPRPAPQNPTAPPGSGSAPAPQTPPGSDFAPQLKRPSPTSAPTPNQMPATNRLLDELKQDPLMRNRTARPIPPTPTVARVGVESDDVLALSLNDAIRRALENNSDIEVARGNVRIAEGTLRSLQGVYDPILNFNPQFTNSVTPTTSSIGGAGSSGTISQNIIQFNSNVTKQFSTGGGNYQFFFNNQRQSTNSIFSRINPFYSSSFGVTFTQPLLRNRSIDTYRHDIRVQRRKLEQSDSDFRQSTIQIIDQVQHAYWELKYALRAQQVAIDSLNLAREQFRVIEQGVAAGTSAPLNRAEVDTEIATQTANLETAAKNVTTAENTFKQLVLRDPSAPEWHAVIMPTDEPSFDLTPVNLSDALTEARASRPELRRLQLQQDINKLDLQFARNQTLPLVNIVSTVSTTGLAGNPAAAASVGGAVPSELVNGQLPIITGDPNSSANAFLLSQINQLRAAQGLQPAQVPLTTPQSQVAPFLVGGYGQTLGNLFTFGTRNIVAGLTIDIPLHNRTAEGNLAVARAQRDQLVASIHSQEQVVESDVRNAVQALETARQTVLTARQARHSAELQLAGELQLFQVGQSTTFLVFQRENTLATARNAELRAEADYNNALADLQRATGTTLRANNVIVETPSEP